MKEKLVELLTKRKETISCCESLTAGLCMATIASVSGASAVLKGGFVTYQSQCKHEFVHVRQSTIDQYGVVSKECAIEMAQNTLEITQSDYALSFTGNAGPSAMENKPAGLVYCAIASKEKVEVYEFHLNMERNELRQYIVDTMIDKLTKQLEE
ncbi:MAG: CinA family protein [Erysipelotrichaceae bacterium]|uniref:CinA family protein n=1 Tax=Floccifex sp. TaxID=2815810 RepID=UPI002A7506A8|nr:CinA family protein [Floccifex sp.]MDD7281527.1 CinA family protein [Erysipelotrichaceae bacterium]MDY2957970.1 CinA family protein [Floccifex sp.]